LCSAAHSKDGVRVGVYYFPGWKDGAEASREFPWKAIHPYPERKPLSGWYLEGDDSITQRQISWMANHKIDYVIYDWYFTAQGIPRLSHAIESYLRQKDVLGTSFAIMWANHSNFPQAFSQFEKMVDYWIDNYFQDPRYELVNNQPLLIIFSPSNLDSKAKSFGSTATELISFIRRRSHLRMGRIPFIVGATHAVERRVNHEFLRHQYDAYTGYNYHYGVEGVFKGANYSHSYNELIDGYSRTWNWMLRNSKLPYMLPVTSGWDRRPWGGSNDPLHDNSGGNPDEFQEHVRSAASLILKNPQRTLGRMHICCWNEYGLPNVSDTRSSHSATSITFFFLMFIALPIFVSP
jgi:hypothetical protein